MMTRALCRTVVLLVGMLCATRAYAHPGSGIVVDETGSVFFADNGGEGGFVWKIDTDGKLTRLSHAGSGTPDDQKPFLRGLAVNASGTLYAAGTGGRLTVKVTPEGQVDVVLKAERPWSPTGVAVHGEDVYVLEYTSANAEADKGWRPRVRKLGRDGSVTTLATISKEARSR